MKKLLLLLNLFLLGLFAISFETSAQTTPIAPKTRKDNLINSYMLYRFIGEVNSPVYLQSPDNVKITYYWYDTRMAFGEKVRTSEEPKYIEECTYKNGRLSFYRKGNVFYRIEWTYDGVINKIIKYNTAGDEISSNMLNLRWTEYTKVTASSRGLVSSHSISISNVLLKERVNYDDHMRIEGYDYIAGKLVIRRVESNLENVRGQIAKAWKDNEYQTTVAEIFSDGRIAPKNSNSNIFDYSDTVRCSYEID